MFFVAIEALFLWKYELFSEGVLSRTTSVLFSFKLSMLVLKMLIFSWNSTFAAEGRLDLSVFAYVGLFSLSFLLKLLLC